LAWVDHGPFCPLGQASRAGPRARIGTQLFMHLWISEICFLI
jgi:hypothetical protein